ncbi:MAG TPA: anthranilate phosphoribosyltransferase, partial [Acidocella sp.]|nr:anthranilate phosphoribosyltransferase [Acidocella sp.]
MTVSLKPVLAKLGRGESLNAAEAEEAFGVVMDGLASPAQIGGMLMAMRARGETVAELTGAVTAMRARMTHVAAPANAMDVCGTGGDAAASL